MSLVDKTIKWYLKNQRVIHVVLLVSLLISFYFVILSTPLISDDLVYMNKWNSSSPLENMGEVVTYQVNHYFNWGGRTVAHSILQVLFLVSRPLSALIITFSFLMLGIIIYKTVYIRKRMDWLKVAFIMALLYFLNPIPQETLFWYTGVANYLITTLFILVAFYPINLSLHDVKLEKYHYSLVAFSFFAGWSNENMSTTFIMMIAISIFLYYQKKRKINKMMMLSLLLASIGCALLLLAPGNFARASTFTSGFMSLMYRGHGQINVWFDWLLVPIICWIATYDFSKKNFAWCSNGIFILWAGLSMLIMAISPVYPERATFGSLVLLLISVLSNVQENEKLDNDKLNVIYLVFALGLTFTCISMAILQYAKILGIVY